MPKYRVEITRTVNYVFEVEAEDETAATDQAYLMKFDGNWLYEEVLDDDVYVEVTDGN